MPCICMRPWAGMTPCRRSAPAEWTSTAGRDGRRYRPAHGSEIGGGDVGARRVSAPVVPSEGAVRAGIDEDDAVAGKYLAQRGDRRGRMDGGGRSAQILDVVEPRLYFDGGKP